MNTPTPETDSTEFEVLLSSQQSGTVKVVRLEVARKLEQERDNFNQIAQQREHQIKRITKEWREQTIEQEKEIIQLRTFCDELANVVDAYDDREMPGVHSVALTAYRKWKGSKCQ